MDASARVIFVELDKSAGRRTAVTPLSTNAAVIARHDVVSASTRPANHATLGAATVVTRICSVRSALETPGELRYGQHGSRAKSVRHLCNIQSDNQ